MMLTAREEQVWLMSVGAPVILYHRNRDGRTSTVAISDDYHSSRHDPVWTHEMPGTIDAAVMVFGLKLAIQTKLGLI